MTVTVSLREIPDLPLEADSITPTHFAGKTIKEIGELPIQQGNQIIPLKDYFDSIGVPSTYIEYDYTLGALAPMRTRVEAFLETIGH